MVINNGRRDEVNSPDRDEQDDGTVIIIEVQGKHRVGGRELGRPQTRVLMTKTCNLRLIKN